MLLTNNQSQQAYKVVFNAIQTNTESLLLWKKYTMVALKNGLTSYADNGLKNVKRLSNELEFKQFAKKYDSILREQADF